MLLGIDLGTSSVKVLLLGSDGTVHGEASHAYPVHAPHVGWSETDPEDWWTAVTEAVQEAVGEDGSEVRAVGLSGQMHGIVLTSAQGQALRPAVLWSDARSSAELDLYRALPDSQRQALANPIAVGMAGPSLLWLRDKEGEAYRQARWVLQPKDWLRMRLTGAVATDPSDASATLLYDLQRDAWAYDVVASLDIRQELLPPILGSEQVAGSLRRSVASDLGLPEGLPVATGASDTASAALGSGLFRDGDAQLTVGSGAQMLSITMTPKAAPEFGVHLYRAVGPNTFYSMAAMQNAGLALEWVLSVLELTWDQAYELAATVEPGCDGMVFLPYLVGERTPHLNPQACGSWIGLRRHHTRAHMMRAALEGVAFAIRDGLQALRKAGIDPSKLRLAGGGTKWPSWRQLLADTLREPLHVSSVTNASARGAAFLAALATGTRADALPVATLGAAVEPGAVNSGLDASYLRFQELYQRVFA